MGVPGKVGSCVTSSEMKKKKTTTLCVYCFSVFVRTVGSPPLGPLKDCWRVSSGFQGHVTLLSQGGSSQR